MVKGQQLISDAGASNGRMPGIGTVVIGNVLEQGDFATYGLFAPVTRR